MQIQIGCRILDSFDIDSSQCPWLIAVGHFLPTERDLSTPFFDPIVLGKGSLDGDSFQTA